MPTGYTSDLHDGKKITFQKFAMSCARAFGALVMMRDEPFDAPIPDEFLPDDYHLKALNSAKRRMSAVRKLSNAKAKQKADKLYEDACKERKKSIAENKTLRKRYESMLVKVKTWTPPTPDHQGLKNFMVEQLESSIRHDCNYTPNKPRRMSGETYKRQLIKDCKWDIKYHTKEHKAELKSAKERTEWVRALRKSLTAIV